MPPTIVSPDDHLQCPPHVWQQRLPARLRSAGPRIERLRGHAFDVGGGDFRFREDPEGSVGDVWHYDGKLTPIVKIAAAAGFSPRSKLRLEPTTFEEIRSGCYDPKARIEDMDTAGILASVNYPNMFVKFAGEQFSFAEDKALAQACIRAYNDYVIEEWCAGSQGRLVPMGLVPLWDIGLAVAEAERLAALGFHSISFVEAPHRSGLPSVSSKYWDPFFQVCADAGMVLSVHIGTSPMQLAAKDAPAAVPHVGASLYVMHTLLEYLFSAVFVRIPKLKVCFAESQLGLVPYVLERADFIWEEIVIDGTATVDKKSIPERPSHYFRQNCWVAFFRDPVGLTMADRIGVDRILFETDYPHLDTEWPNCQTAAEEMLAALPPDSARKIMHENAAALFNIEAVA
ncbi:MAG: amidohydrolase [Pseudomonadales bacterium]|nr:amidohydrolase [Pseudomonadales bacterium]